MIVSFLSTGFRFKVYILSSNDISLYGVPVKLFSPPLVLRTEKLRLIEQNGTLFAAELQRSPFTSADACRIVHVK
jgi:hypothetical protein